MRDIDHDEYLTADETRDAVRAAWWAGYFVGIACGAVCLLILWAGGVL